MDRSLKPLKSLYLLSRACNIWMRLPCGYTPVCVWGGGGGRGGSYDNASTPIHGIHYTAVFKRHSRQGRQWSGHEQGASVAEESTTAEVPDLIILHPFYF